MEYLVKAQEYLKLKIKDTYRLAHSYRVANIGKEIAKKEGLNVEDLMIACLLHDDDDASSNMSLDEKMVNTVNTIIEGLGGRDNIVVVNNCISRLRVDVKDMAAVNEDMLKKTGSMGIVKPSDTHIQVIYGPKVEKIADAVREVLKY